MKSLVVIMSLIATPVLAQPPADSLRARMPAMPETLSRVVRLPEVVVSTSRADDRTPVAKSVLDRMALKDRAWGQDTPMALATLPGVYAYSDAGNGIGYSYLSIRGFPQRRISVLINGVPLNDPESHEVYWIDHPDLLASTGEVQVQRGVGSALYGAASLGGSVNLETAPFGSTPRTSAVLAYGSFDTRRLMLEMDSGDLAGGWNYYGRYSRIETDGYRDQSWTKLWSYALSARKVAGRHAFRANLYGGPEETHLAYLGVSSDYLAGLATGDRDRDRRINPLAYPGEADHFFEPHYELVHSWSPRDGLALTQTLFYFDGRGFYDERRILQSLADYRLSPWATSDPALFGPDSLAYYANDGTTLTRDAQGRVTVQSFDAVRRRWVGNRHFGWVPRLRIEHAGGVLTLGGELRWHDGHHVGTVVSGSGLPPATEPDHIYYDYHPRTFAGGLFMREEWQARRALWVSADLAWRHQGYFMRGDLTDPVFHPQPIRFDQSYDFAIPRVGLTWRGDGPWQVFGAVSHSRREPAFRDLYDAEGVGSVPLLKNGEPLVRPERVNDYELGAVRRQRAVTVSANLFRMDFRDELVYAGQFNSDLGYPILGNAARSVHQGVEIEGHTLLGSQFEGGALVERHPGFGVGRRVELELSANATLSDNHFIRFREFSGPRPSDETSYDGKAIGFFPAVLAKLAARLGWRGATLGAEAQRVGRMYLDNTEDAAGSIRPHTVLNLSAGYRAVRPLDGGPMLELTVRVLNALDARYETGGYSYLYGGTRYTDFIPAATRNAIAQVRVEF